MALSCVCDYTSISRLSLNLVNTCYKPKLRLFSRASSVFKQTDKIESIESTSYKSTQQPKTYTVVYRNPYIRIGAVVNMLKWPQTLAAGVSIPLCTLLYFFEVISGSLAVVTLYTGVALTASFYIAGLGFYRSVGFIYLSEDDKTVKISYINFWGRRIDLERPIDDFMFFSEIPKKSTDFVYKTLLLNSSPEKFKLPLEGCHILDEEKFKKIFGALKFGLNKLAH